MRGPSASTGKRVRISADQLAAGGPVATEVSGRALVVARRPGGAWVALDGHCPHAGAPLAAGLVLGDCLACPRHHAKFRLGDGAAVGGPTLNGLQRYACRPDGDGLIVTDAPLAPVGRPGSAASLRRIVLVGGGAASLGAAAELRRMGYSGRITVVGDDADGFYDRTKLSKGALAASPRRADVALDVDPLGLDCRWGWRVERLDLARRTVVARRCSEVAELSFDACLLATGASPRREVMPGASDPRVVTLRGLEDARRLDRQLSVGGEAVLIGGSFIALELAAALRGRGTRAKVVAPTATPLAHLIGAPMGRWLADLHQSRGVEWFAGRRATAIAPDAVLLEGGGRVSCRGPVILAVGVIPNVALAEEAGLRVGDGIRVDSDMRTSDPRVLAAGDVAHVEGPDGWGRVEHWSVALWQGRRAARTMVGALPVRHPPPFFWTRQFDQTLTYVGAAAKGAEVESFGNPAAGSAAALLWSEGRPLGVAAVGRAHDSLRAEARLAERRFWELREVLAS